MELSINFCNCPVDIESNKQLEAPAMTLLQLLHRMDSKMCLCCKGANFVGLGIGTFVTALFRLPGALTGIFVAMGSPDGMGLFIFYQLLVVKKNELGVPTNCTLHQKVYEIEFIGGRAKDRRKYHGDPISCSLGYPCIG